MRLSCHKLIAYGWCSRRYLLSSGAIRLVRIRRTQLYFLTAEFLGALLTAQASLIFKLLVVTRGVTHSHLCACGQRK
jgi:hypothetical protein